MTEGLRTLVVAATALAAGYGLQAIRTAAVPVSSPDRLVSELRLAQIGALMLTLAAGAYLGFAAMAETRTGVGLDIALAIGFLVLAGYTLTCDPRQALTLLALAFATHALLDIAHRPGVLPEDIVPRWYTIGCAVLNVAFGAFSYLPLLRRQ